MNAIQETTPHHNKSVEDVALAIKSLATRMSQEEREKLYYIIKGVELATDSIPHELKKWYQHEKQNERRN